MERAHAGPLDELTRERGADPGAAIAAPVWTRAPLDAFEIPGWPDPAVDRQRTRDALLWDAPRPKAGGDAGLEVIVTVFFALVGLGLFGKTLAVFLMWML